MDRESVMAWLEGLAQDDWRMFHSDSEVQEIARNALELLKEQEETINVLTDTIQQLNQHIKDLSEYMTPYGMVKDVKAYCELLKEQEAVEPVLEQDSMVCGNCGHEVIWQRLLGDDVWSDEYLEYCPHCGQAVKWE